MLVVVPHTSVQGEPGVVFNPKTTRAGLFTKIIARTKASILEESELSPLNPIMMSRSETESDGFCYSDRQVGESGQSAG